MAKGKNHRLRLLYLNRIMLQTNENNKISMQEIIDKLKEYNIDSDRKGLYNDFEELRIFGTNVLKGGSARNTRYYVADEQLESSDLKLLIGAVQTSQFLTVQKTNSLTKKLIKLYNNEDSSLYDRKVYIEERTRNMDKSVFKTLDVIYQAITNNKMVLFYYYSWNLYKEKEFHNNGQYIEVSPWAIVWNRDRYYLVAYLFKGETKDYTKEIRHYRLDKIYNPSISDSKRKGGRIFNDINMDDYIKQSFGMFAGKVETVTLECANNKANVIIDRFGMDVPIEKVDEEKFRVDIKVAISPKFYSWIMAYGKDVKIVGPESVVKEMKERVNELNVIYDD